MSGETTVTPGKTYDEAQGEKIDLAKSNLAAKPSVRVNEQSIGNRELIDGSITADKLTQDVLDQINADAIIADGSITSAKIAAGAVTKSKLNQDVLDCFVRRDAVDTTIGSFLRYTTTDGITEEVTENELFNQRAEAVEGRTTTTTQNITLSNDITDLRRIAGGFSVYFGFNSISTSSHAMSGSFCFVKNSGGTWDGALSGGNGIPSAGPSSTFIGTGTTSISGTSSESGGTSVTITLSITGTTLTSTISTNVAGGNVDAQSVAVNALVE